MRCLSHVIKAVLASSLCLNAAAGAGPSTISEAELKQRLWAYETVKSSRRYGGLAPLALSAAPYLTGDAAARASKLQDITAALYGLNPRTALATLGEAERKALGNAMRDAFADNANVPTSAYTTWATIKALGDISRRGSVDAQQTIAAVSSLLGVAPPTDLSAALQLAGMDVKEVNNIARLVQKGALTEDKLKELTVGLVDSATQQFNAEVDKLSSLVDPIKIGTLPSTLPSSATLEAIAKFESTGAAINALAGLMAASGNPELAKLATNIATFGQVVTQLSTLTKLASVGSIGAASLATGYFGVAMALVSMFGSNGQGQSAQDAMLDFMAKNFEHLNKRLDIVEKKLDILDKKMNAVLDATLDIQRSLLELKQMNAALAERLAKQSAIISQIGVQSLPLLLEIAEAPLKSSLDECLNHRIRFPDATLTIFPQCVSGFYDFAVNRSVSATGVESTGDLLTNFLGEREDRLIRLVGSHAVANKLVADEHASLFFAAPNPSLWLTATQAYLDLLRGYPNEAVSYQSKADIEAMLSRGQQALAALSLLSNRELLHGQMALLQARTEELEEALTAAGTAVVEHQGVRQAGGIERWNRAYWEQTLGGAPGTSALSGPYATAMMPCNTKAGLPALTYPDGWEEFEPLLWRMLDSVKDKMLVCYETSWTGEFLGLHGRLVIDIIYRYPEPDGSWYGFGGKAYQQHSVRVQTSNEYRKAAGLFSKSDTTNYTLEAINQNWDTGEKLRDAFAKSYSLCKPQAVEDGLFGIGNTLLGPKCDAVEAGDLLASGLLPLEGTSLGKWLLWRAAIHNQGSDTPDGELDKQLSEVRRQLRVLEILMHYAYPLDPAPSSHVMGLAAQAALIEQWVLLDGVSDEEFERRFGPPDPAPSKLFCWWNCDAEEVPERTATQKNYKQARDVFDGLEDPQGSQSMTLMLLRLSALLAERHGDAFPADAANPARAKLRTCVEKSGEGAGINKAVSASRTLRECLA